MARVGSFLSFENLAFDRLDEAKLATVLDQPDLSVRANLRQCIINSMDVRDQETPQGTLQLRQGSMRGLLGGSARACAAHLSLLVRTNVGHSAGNTRLQVYLKDPSSAVS
jgi:hypothetical protein